MNDWLTLVISGLAGWRLAYMLVNESGPFDVFGRLRYLAGIRQIVVHGPDGQAISAGYTATNTLAEGLMCVWCVSVWTAVFCALITLVGPIGVWLVRILAISGLAIIMHELVMHWRGGEST